jgi:hypothetical protein
MAPVRAAIAPACEPDPAMKPATTPEALETDDCTATVPADPVGKANGAIVRVDGPLPEIESIVTRGAPAGGKVAAMPPDTVRVLRVVAIPPPSEAAVVSTSERVTVLTPFATAPFSEVEAGGAAPVRVTVLTPFATAPFSDVEAGGASPVRVTVLTPFATAPFSEVEAIS